MFIGWVHGCVCASRADEMKNGGCYMCQQNAYPNNKEGLHVFQPSWAACVFTMQKTTPSRPPMKVSAHRSINSQPVQQSLEVQYFFML